MEANSLRFITYVKQSFVRNIDLLLFMTFLQLIGKYGKVHLARMRFFFQYSCSCGIKYDALFVFIYDIGIILINL